MKKVISILLSVLLISCLPSSNTFANNRESDIIKMHQNQIEYNNSKRFQSEEPMSKTEVDKIIKGLQEDYIKNHRSTEKERNDALEKAAYVESIIESSIEINTEVQNEKTTTFALSVATETYDENKLKLRQGNFIEGILDTDEGMTSSQIFTLGTTTANSAKNIAAAQYPNDAMLQDAYRHFTWNYISVFNSSLGIYPTYIGTVNHEWGLILLNPLTNYYDSQYQSYLNEGYASNQSAVWAFSDAINYIPIMKSQLVVYCKNGYSFFSGLMSSGNIMDFMNNFEGRYYALGDSTSNCKGAFDRAISAGVIIKSESSVGDSQKRSLWNLGAYY